MRAHCCFLNAGDISGRHLADGRGILGAIGFGTGPSVATIPGVPSATVALKRLQAGPDIEVWVSDEAVTYGTEHGIAFASSETSLFGVVRPDTEAGDIGAVARNAYERIFAICAATGHPHVVRAFQYISAITQDEDGLERYRKFNAGRSEAFAACGRSMADAPAACALGTQAGDPVIYFLASRDKGRAIENPRQVSAYHYPPQYGARSPSFSRAMMIGRTLYISGTASIVGHQSRHLGDPEAQTAEILRNFDALLHEAAACTVRDVQSSLGVKVYLRHSQDLAPVRQALSALQPGSGTMVLQADICRRDLLVEIEAFCRLPVSSAL